MKKIFTFIFIASIFAACNDDKTDINSADEAQSQNGKYDAKRGEGKFKDIKLAEIDPVKAAHGHNIAETKCLACHKLTKEKLVGPGWKGVTKRHTPEWIMNFITNPEAMIDKDPKLQEQLEICMVRMPNQDLHDDGAFSILEFMRQNDSK